MGKEKTQFKKGYVPWNKGTKGLMTHTQEWKSKISEKMKGNKNSFGYKQTEEHIQKALKKNPKSTLEIKFESIINELKLPYKFVGNGEVLIGRKCPDFVNTNGQKIAVEVYYRRHKNLFKNGLDQWKEEREKIFAEYGWQTIFFDETQVNKEIIGKHLRR